jgi:hypothetical protein
MIKGAEQPAIQVINTKAVAMIAVTATAWFSFLLVGLTGISFTGASSEMVDGH